MSATGLEVFDTTLHRTHAWLKDLMLVDRTPRRAASDADPGLLL
jgi:hypothetical protein